MITLDEWITAIEEILSKRGNVEVKIKLKEGDNNDN